MELTQNSVAVISGAASGIGRALVAELGSIGCRVVAADQDSDGLKSLGAEFSGLEMLCVPLDVRDRVAVEALAETTLNRFGQVDLVINNAGVSLCQNVESMDYEDFEWVMRINFWGMIHGTTAFLPQLLKQGHGTVVFLSSIMGICSAPTQSAYNASKFGIRGFAESLHQEVAGRGVNTLVVCPGGVRTNIIRNARIRSWMADFPGTRGDPIADFERIARTTPESAARQILRAVRKDRRRLLIGSDARWMDRLQRLAPTAYPGLLRRLMGLLARSPGLSR